MSDQNFEHELNLGIVLVPVGVIGLIGTFWFTIIAAQAKTGIPAHTVKIICVLFGISLLFTALGGSTKIISSLSSGRADDVIQ